MKREIARYVSECDTCQKVKADYMKPGGFLQHLSIPDWKWDDKHRFYCGFTFDCHKFDSIWVIVDRLTKSAHFIPINTTYKVQKYAEIYIAQVLCLHGVLKTIISDRGVAVFRSLLGAAAHISWDSFDPQFSLSSAEEWPS
jgi:hypothetical protein